MDVSILYYNLHTITENFSSWYSIIHYFNIIQIIDNFTFHKLGFSTRDNIQGGRVQRECWKI